MRVRAILPSSAHPPTSVLLGTQKPDYDSHSGGVSEIKNSGIDVGTITFSTEPFIFHVPATLVFILMNKKMKDNTCCID
jgi:hypothetical protein